MNCTEKEFRIGRKFLGGNHPTFIIAELSANHNQSFEQAIKLVEAAAQAGADAVKLQTYTADTLTIDSDAEPFRIVEGNLWSGKTLHEVYREAQAPWDWLPPLKARAEELGMECFSSAFDFSSAEYLQSCAVPAYKIASFELVDLPLIQKVAEAGKPIILSTGMATEEEIGAAVEVARKMGCEDLALLKCTSAYPAPAGDMNLRAIARLQNLFGVVPGLSDHSMDVEIPVVAVALGARILEKHLILSRSMPGPDSAFSLEPEEFAHMVQAVRLAEKALGKSTLGPSPREENLRIYRRSLFVVQDIPQGGVLTQDNVRSIRPGHGLHPRHYQEMIGCQAARPIPRGTPLTWDDLVRPSR